MYLYLHILINFPQIILFLYSCFFFEQLLLGITFMEKQSYRILIHGNNAVKSTELFERLQLSYPDNNCIEMEQARLEFYAYPDLNLFNRFKEPQIDANIISLIGHAGNSPHCESGISLFIILISQTEIFSRDMQDMITNIAQNKHFKSEKYFWDHATILFAFEEIVGNYREEVERSINGNVGIKEVMEKAGKRYFWMSSSCTKDELGASIISQCKNVKGKSRLRRYWLLILPLSPPLVRVLRFSLLNRVTNFFTLLARILWARKYKLAIFSVIIGLGATILRSIQLLNS